MKKLLLSSAVSLCALGMSSNTLADTLGLTVGAFAWQQDFSGDIQSGDTGDVISIDKTLGYDDDETNGFFYAALEHPIPFIPNVMLARTEIDASATETSSFTFDGIDFNGTIDSSTDLSHTDLTLYYEILDNWVSLDIGLTVRTFDEGFEITGDTNLGTDKSDLEVDETIPMFYVGTKFELPLSGLYVSAGGNWVSYDDDELLDYKVALGYETDIGLGIEAGFRSFEIDYEDDDEFADTTTDGAYAGIFYHF